MDPQFSRTSNNQATAQSIFDRLVGADEKLRPVPGSPCPGEISTR